MKCVVTGGAGFIGSHLSEALLAMGEVVVIDDLSLGKRTNVPTGARLREGTILDRALLAEEFDGADYVFHEAALPSVPRSIEDPFASHQANVTGTLHVLMAARDAGVRKVVLAASSSAYGDSATLPKHELMVPLPKSPYAAAKLAAEMYARAFYDSYGLRTTSLRYFNVYGPRQDPRGAYAAVIPKFFAAALRGDPLVIHGDGSQSRDFTYVTDVVRANILAATSTNSDGAVINVGAGERTTISEIAKTIVALTGSRSRIEQGPARAGDIAHSLASLDRAATLLGYAPSVRIKEGLARCLAAIPAGAPMDMS